MLFIETKIANFEHTDKIQRNEMHKVFKWEAMHVTKKKYQIL